MASRAASRARSLRHEVRSRGQHDSRPSPSAHVGRLAPLIFVIALAVRLAHLWSMRKAPFFDILLGDSQSYDGWAQQIAAGDYVGQGVFYQAPLYAYFLGSIYTIHRSLLLVRTCQAVIGAVSCVLLGYAAHHLFGKPAGVVAALMLAFYAPAVFFDGLVQKSVLDVFFLCLLLAQLSRVIAPGNGGPTSSAKAGDSGRGSGALLAAACSRWRWLAMGLSLGALTLTRENTLIFAPVLLAWIWWQIPSRGQARVSIASALVAGLAVVLLPVGLRNRIAGGEFHLTTAQFGPNVFIGNNAQADGSYVPLRYGRGSPEYEQVDATELAIRAMGRPLKPGEVSDYWPKRALDYISEHPATWLGLEGRKFRLLWNGTELADTESEESHEDYSPLLRLIGHVAHFGLLAPLACLGVWVTWNERSRLWLLHAMVGAYVVSVLGFYVVARYRLPLVPFVIVFAAVAVVRGRRFLLTRRSDSAIAGTACLAAVTVFCNVPVISADTMRAVTYQNLGAALQETGRLDEAATAYRRALALQPDFAPAHNNLGALLRQQGQLVEAVPHLERALQLRPDFEDASLNLANALADRGDLSEAIVKYEDLLRRRPQAGEVHSNLGITLARAGRLDEAIQHFRTAAALAPEAAKAHFNLGQSLLTRGALEEAVEQLSQAVTIDPADASAHYELGNAYLAQQRRTEAVGQLREAVRLAPTLVEAHNNLGIALGSLGRLDEAIAEFRTVLQIDAGFSQARANLKTALAGLEAAKGEGRDRR